VPRKKQELISKLVPFSLSYQPFIESEDVSSVQNDILTSAFTPKKVGLGKLKRGSTIVGLFSWRKFRQTTSVGYLCHSLFLTIYTLVF